MTRFSNMLPVLFDDIIGHHLSEVGLHNPLMEINISDICPLSPIKTCVNVGSVCDLKPPTTSCVLKHTGRFSSLLNSV